MRSLQIVENSPQQLIAVQTATSLGWLYAIFITVAVAAAIWMVWTRQWRLLGVPALVIALFGFFALLPKPPIYTLTIDFAANAVLSRATRGSADVSSFTVKGRDLSAADMQSNRGATAIALTRQDGSLLFPLGEEMLQNEPDQYVVLTALRKVIANGTQQ